MEQVNQSEDDTATINADLRAPTMGLRLLEAVDLRGSGQDPRRTISAFLSVFRASLAGIAEDGE